MINFDDNWPTIPELIQNDSDYTTCAFDNLMNFSGHMKHLARGFQYYINVSQRPEPPCFILGEDINRKLLPWLKAHKREDFFLFIHYWEPHKPYNQPPKYQHPFQHKADDLSDLKIKKAEAGYEYVPGWGKVDELLKDEDRKSEIDLYDGEIRYLDHLIEEIFSCLEEEKLLPETVFILTSDHGEYLGDIFGGQNVYSHPAVHFPDSNVPLIFWGPEFFASEKRVKGFAQQIDAPRTILELMKIRQKPNLPGLNLIPYLKGQKKKIDREFAVCEGNVNFVNRSLGRRALIWNDWEYIWNLDGTEQLYNLRQDPCERIDLEGKELEVLHQLRKKLTQWRRENTPERHFDPIYRACTLLEKYETTPLYQERPIFEFDQKTFWKKDSTTPTDYY